MSIIKHDTAVQNSQVNRGEVRRTNNQKVYECGCGCEGCFLHVSY